MVSKKQKALSSREKIIAAIRQGKPEGAILPSLQFCADAGQDLLTTFSNAITAIGGGCNPVNDYRFITTGNKEDGLIINAIRELPDYNIEEFTNAGAAELNELQTFFVKGTIAVAENGAVWLTEKDMHNRLLPFLCRQLVIAVEEADIVFNMHQAYEKIAINAEGYGVFIAGPSKTADIEQSLVVGAHGPLSLQVFVVKREN